MISGIFHKGSGLGNQLFRYVGSRVMALDKGEEHTMVAPELFKGEMFMDLDMGVKTDIEYHIEEPAGKVVPENVEDITVVDGEFQGEQYFMHRIDEVRKWLAVEPLEMSDDVCVIGFRGGEYVGVRDWFLPKSYYEEAVTMMMEKYPDIKFHVVTDDVPEAERMFRGLDCVISHEISMDWRMIRYAKHLILANSSFFILPALLNEDIKEVIAPMYWGGRNVGKWHLEDNNYKKFTYI